MNTLKMPQGYTLIRYGWFRWGWMRNADAHFSFDTKLTAAGAMRYAARHADMMFTAYGEGEE